MTYADLWNKWRFKLSFEYVRSWSRDGDVAGYIYLAKLTVSGQMASIEVDMAIRGDPSPTEYMQLLARDIRVYNKAGNERDYRAAIPRARQSYSQFLQFCHDLYLELPEEFLEDLSYLN